MAQETSRDTSHDHAHDAMQECIEECLNCHAVCTITFQHGPTGSATVHNATSERGGMHLAPV